jgi:hypothetical protein
VAELESTQFMPAQGTTEAGSTEDTPLPWDRPDMELIFRDRNMTMYIAHDRFDLAMPYQTMTRRQRALLRTHLELALEELSDWEGRNDTGHPL